MSKPRKIALFLVVLLLAASALVGFGAGPLVRSVAQKRAERLGLSVNVDSVRPAWLGVRLSGVRVTCPLVPAASVLLDSVVVKRKQIFVQGGTLSINKPVETLREQIKHWKASRPRSSQAAVRSSSWNVSVDNLAVQWSNPFDSGSSLSISGLRFSNQPETRDIFLQSLQLLHPKARLSASDVTTNVAISAEPLFLSASSRIGSLRASRLRAELFVDAIKRASLVAIAPVEPVASPSADPSGGSAGSVSGSVSTGPVAQPFQAVSDVPAVSRSRASARGLRYEGVPKELKNTSEKHDPGDRAKPSHGLHISDLRDQLAQLAQKLWEPMAQDASVTIDAFEVKLSRAGQALQLGPGKLSIEPVPGFLQVDLQPIAPSVADDSLAAGANGITFRGVIPRGPGAVALDVVGGPIPLSALGVQEGNLGLVNVKDAILTSDGHFRLDASGKKLWFDGVFGAKNISVFDKRLARNPVIGLELAARLKGDVALDGSHFRLQQSQIEIGKVQLFLSGTVDRSENSENSENLENKLRMDLKLGLGLISCQDFLNSLPQTLTPVVHGMQSSGTLSLSGELKYDDRKPKDFVLKYQYHNDCRITWVPPALDVRNFQGPFRLRAYDPKGNAFFIDTGPQTPVWVQRGAISEWMLAAVMTCEDRAFPYHRGFDREAIRNSVRDNLVTRKFLRGASTVTMQLAKNLYLSREKTVARKLQELILTIYLEQQLSKNQILELYLNVIEFAPNTYGIGPASTYYFNTRPSDLSVTQAMFLASILSNPKRNHFESSGSMSAGWMRYLHKLLQTAGRKHWITQEQMQVGLGEWLVKGQREPNRILPLDPAE